MNESLSQTRISGVALIVLCFFLSAMMRVVESGPALAEGITALATEDSAGEISPPQAKPAEDADALLLAIREREDQLDREASDIAGRSQALSEAEDQLAEQLAAFEQARLDLEETLAMADRAAEKDIERMTAVYESMDPGDAARIIERMEISFAAGLLARMEPEATAQVLASMEPDTAYAVTLTITSQNLNVPTE